MGYLLDTHTFLWWISDDPRISHKVRSVIADPENEIYLSVASVWEIVIKAQLGRIRFAEDPRHVLVQQIAENGFSELPIETRHVFQISSLPYHHRDPFDRMLIAQSIAEGLPLLTTDSAITQYDVDTVW